MYVSAISVQWPGGVKVPGSSSQNCAICYCSSVSAALVSSTAFTWPMKAGEP